MSTKISAPLRDALSPVVRWMRLDRAIRTLTLSLFYISICWLTVFALSKFFLLPTWTLPVLLLSGILVLLSLVLLKLAIGPSLRDGARLVDQKLSLKERLATVCELDEQQDQSEVASILRRDAQQHLSKITPRHIVSLSIPHHTRWTLGILAVTALLFFVPPFHREKEKQKVADKELIKAAGQRIELMARRVQENPTFFANPEKPEVIKKLDETGKLLSGGTLSKQEALRQLTKVTDDLKRKEQSLQSRDGAKPLNRDAQREREQVSPEQMQALRQKQEELSQKLGKSEGSEKQLRKMEKSVRQAQDSIKSGKVDSAAAKDGMQDALSQTLAEAEAAGLTQTAEDLAKAIEALQGAEVGQVLKHLDDAMIDLGEAKKNMQAMAQVMKEMQKAGKDLAEQLERGQMKLAQETLQQLKKSVEQNGLSQEQKKKLSEELSKALAPSKDIGKLSEHLQQALTQCEQGNEGKTGEALQQALNELQQLGQQQQEQAQLAKMIDELNKAGNMMSTGCKSGQCSAGLMAGQNAGQLGSNGRPGSGKGKGGSGVGTWPDEGQGLPGMSSSWDNSGVSRPDMNPRGQSDRGDPKNPDGTQTFKVNGKMGSGGPMPGVRLQGVSIKGQSTAQVEEAFSSAAQEAESALTKETVPAAYQESVKEYFDLN